MQEYKVELFNGLESNVNKIDVAVEHEQDYVAKQLSLLPHSRILTPGNIESRILSREVERQGNIKINKKSYIL